MGDRQATVEHLVLALAEDPRFAEVLGCTTGFQVRLRRWLWWWGGEGVSSRRDSEGVGGCVEGAERGASSGERGENRSTEE
jgi:hypothetical protein